MLAPGVEYSKVEEVYLRNIQDFSMFLKEVLDRTTLDQEIIESAPPIIYTSKSRMKSKESLKKKVIESSRIVTEENLLQELSDFAGARLVILHANQIEILHRIINKNIANGRWILREQPKAYETDSRSKKRLEALGCVVEAKESYYTSVHYIIGQSSDPRICCELQVRTLFEEIWGEVDHFIKYKRKESGDPAESVDLQLRCFAQIVQSGKSFLDIIFEKPKSTSAPDGPAPAELTPAAPP